MHVYVLIYQVKSTWNFKKI